jgi:signal transduction histidine kinase
VKSHGGRLRANANSGPGATFLFTLPTEPEELTATLRLERWT